MEIFPLMSAPNTVNVLVEPPEKVSALNVVVAFVTILCAPIPSKIMVLPV
jgi:hypothetical protein